MSSIGSWGVCVVVDDERGGPAMCTENLLDSNTKTRRNQWSIGNFKKMYFEAINLAMKFCHNKYDRKNTQESYTLSVKQANEHLL